MPRRSLAELRKLPPSHTCRDMEQLLTRSCWSSQDWAAAIAMIAVYLIFFIEFGAHRIGKAKMAKLNMDYGESSSKLVGEESTDSSAH